MYTLQLSSREFDHSQKKASEARTSIWAKPISTQYIIRQLSPHVRPYARVRAIRAALASSEANSPSSPHSERGKKKKNTQRARLT